MKERYKSSVPRILDYTILFLSITIFFFGPVFIPNNFCWPAIFGIFIPWILSIIPSKLECDEKNLVMHDLIRGKRIIPLSDIKSIQMKGFYVNVSAIGSSFGSYVHHFEFEMEINTNKKKYKFRMDAKKKIVKNLGDISYPERYWDKVAFFKLKKYIESHENYTGR